MKSLRKKVLAQTDVQQCAALVSLLFAARNQAHYIHLNTRSYAVHKALNDYYSGLVDLADNYAENAQGRYGLIESYPTSDLSALTDPIKLVDEVRY